MQHGLRLPDKDLHEMSRKREPSGRKREISIRLAMGATRGRIVAQLITEAIVLAIAGAITNGKRSALGTRRWRPGCVPTAVNDLDLRP